MKSIAHFLATFFCVGYLKPASGTWGSAAAILAAWGLHLLGGPLALAIGILAAWFIGVWATQQVIAGQEDHDPSEIVIDEVAGQWIAFFPVSLGAAHVGADLTALYPGWIGAFLAFRLFDIWKPWLVGRADRRGDAIGVMLDDVIAGIMAAVVVVALAALSHLVLLA